MGRPGARSDPRLHLAWPLTTPEECGEAAAYAVEKLGFTGLKFDPFGDEYMDISHEGLAFGVACIKAAVRRSARGRTSRLMGIGALGRRRRFALPGRWNPLT